MGLCRVRKAFKSSLRVTLTSAPHEELLLSLAPRVDSALEGKQTVL